MPPRDIRVIKVPLPESQRQRDYSQSFARMGRLYLELIENKSKIKQDLINKEYVPSNNNGGATRIRELERNDRNRDSDIEDDRDNYRDRPRDLDSDIEDDRNRDNDSEVDRDRERESSAHTPQISRTSSASEQLRPRVAESTTSSRRSSSTSQESAVSGRLRELLDDDERERERDDVSLPNSRHLTPYKSPPTLAELKAKGQFEGNTNLRDINHVPVSEQEMEDKKRELLFKYDLLKKSYPNASSSIPEYTIHSDYEQMRKTYDSTVKRLSLDSTVDNYKQYMIGGFMLVEFVMGNFLGFEMQGFTQQQIVNMSSYERLLIELGEKSYVPTGSKWPVEIRLLFLVIVNAGFFIVSKMILKKTGANLLNMINGMNVNNNARPAQAPSDSPIRARRRMKGPTINIDDIPDIQA